MGFLRGILNRIAIGNLKGSLTGNYAVFLTEIWMETLRNSDRIPEWNLEGNSDRNLARSFDLKIFNRPA